MDSSSHVPLVTCMFPSSPRLLGWAGKQCPLHWIFRGLPECANVPSCRICFMGGASALHQWQAGHSVPGKGDPRKKCQSKVFLTHWSAAASFPERQATPVAKAKACLSSSCGCTWGKRQAEGFYQLKALFLMLLRLNELLPSTHFFLFERHRISSSC